MRENLNKITPVFVRRGYEAIWGELPGVNQVFSPDKVLSNFDKNYRRDARRYIARLINAGYLKEWPDNQLKVLRKPVVAPRFNAAGSEYITKNQMMWNAMRQLPRWTCEELALAASLEHNIIKITTAKRYVGSLNGAGYVQELVPAMPGKCPAVYRLKASQNSGPEAPQVMRINGVYDPNKKAFCGHSEAREMAA